MNEDWRVIKEILNFGLCLWEFITEIRFKSKSLKFWFCLGFPRSYLITLERRFKNRNARQTKSVILLHLHNFLSLFYCQTRNLLLFYFPTALFLPVYDNSRSKVSLLPYNKSENNITFKTFLAFTNKWSNCLTVNFLKIIFHKESFLFFLKWKKTTSNWWQ